MRTLQDLKKHVEAKAQARGAEALAHLAAERARFRLARQLVEARKERGLTQSKVAALAGISQGDVSRIEHGQINASSDSLARLAFVYDGELAIQFRLKPAKPAVRARKQASTKLQEAPRR